ncbi:TIGR03089 family protein [Phytohabitans sp. ZYX-F-186]|uniref:TIGR03089 family protein n=1 Tax=Phytohabitans maris TaxID=3071409 RepID=A0ABU0ZP64_9ACTN|nr:TIGR03089 family protein [Phytohabitans sp. ZYX-F-186]MDQ7907717.1 TIGR03089 family protein [Phytohabitans sp. ZYX-F-186]
MIERFATAAAEDPAQPLLTWYDDATGDRTELSGATLDNWVAKTANLLVDGLGLGSGDRAGVLLPPHWQTAAVLLGAWAAGVEVVAPGAQVTNGKISVDVIFAAADRVNDAAEWSAGDRFVLGLAPMALPMRTVPSGFVDYAAEVLTFGDHFTPYPDQSDRSLVERAAARAADLGLKAGDRVLVDAAKHPDPLDWLLAPLAGGATLVLCAALDPAKLDDRAAAEKVTARLV